MRYILSVMIQSFSDEDTYGLFTKRKSRHWSNVQTVALRKLDQLEAAVTLDDLKIPPGNKLEALKGSRKGQHSIRVNDQFRICFAWREDGAYEVEIVDYH